MSHAKSSFRWLKEHHNDPYVKLALKQGFRSRAVYKLLALHEKDRLLTPGQTVLDLGAAPGGWSQLAKQKVGPKGTVLALDILPITPLDEVTCIQGDLHQDSTLTTLRECLPTQVVDLVMSDMAPNLSGISSVDQPRMVRLAELARDIALTFLKPKAHFLVKCFQGQGFEAYFQSLRIFFDRVVTRKPPASRSRSSEVYLIAKGRK